MLVNGRSAIDLSFGLRRRTWRHWTDRGDVRLAGMPLPDLGSGARYGWRYVIAIEKRTLVRWHDARVDDRADADSAAPCASKRAAMLTPLPYIGRSFSMMTSPRLIPIRARWSGWRAFASAAILGAGAFY